MAENKLKVGEAPEFRSLDLTQARPSKLRPITFPALSDIRLASVLLYEPDTDFRGSKNLMSAPPTLCSSPPGSTTPPRAKAWTAP